MALKKVTLLIPLTFNDGSAVAKELLESIEEEIYVAFNGWTVAGEVRGSYRMKATGHKQVDKLLEAWVVVEDAEIPQLRKMVARFGTMLRQECMFFEIGDSVIEFIPPQPGGDPDND